MRSQGGAEGIKKIRSSYVKDVMRLFDVSPLRRACNKERTTRRAPKS